MTESLVRDLATVSGRASLSVQERADLRVKITELEHRLKEEIQLDLPVTHHFSKDVYSRELFIPKGTMLIGAIHKFQNFNIISRGDVSFFSVDGAFRAQAPHSFVASPGVKRVIYAHDDTVWTTIHGTGEIDLKKIEEIFIATDYSQVDGITAEELRFIKGAL